MATAALTEHRRFVPILFWLALGFGIAGACDSERLQLGDEDDIARRLQADMDLALTQSALTSSQLKAIRPVLKCVDRLAGDIYRAHFGYSNTSTASIPIPVGFNNRFYPNPAGRGQPTLFTSGAQADVVQVQFSGNSAVAWVLGNAFQIATRNTNVCPTMGGTGGAGGIAGVGGRGGAAGSGSGGGGTGGSTGACPSTCDDHNPCTVDLCSAATGFQCSNVIIQNGTSCSDGNACTTGDTCQAGACVSGTLKTCPAIDQCHLSGVCAPATGACSNPVAANGSACTDGNACTVGDTCQGGVCAGGTPKTCAASDQCHVTGVCAPATGACSNPPAPNGTPCNDGNMCSTSDTCQTGICRAAVVLPPTHCVGGAICDACTTDNCIPSTDGCDQIADSNDRQLCETLYACFTDPSNNCVVQGDPSPCWCGSNVDTCFVDNLPPTRANGPCQDAVFRASKLVVYDAASIKMLLVDPDLPLGRAVNLTSCRGAFCSVECGVH